MNLTADWGLMLESVPLAGLYPKHGLVVLKIAFRFSYSSHLLDIVPSLLFFEWKLDILPVMQPSALCSPMARR